MSNPELYKQEYDKKIIATVGDIIFFKEPIYNQIVQQWSYNSIFHGY